MASDTLNTPGLLRQVLVGLVLVSMNMSIGFNVSWPVVLPIGNDTVNAGINLTQLDMQWLVSVRSVSGCLAPLFAGVLMEALGPRRQLFLCLLPTVGLWLLMAAIPLKAVLYAGRAALGVTVSMLNTVVLSLSTELLSPGLRGISGAMQRVSSSLGCLIVYIMASFLHWRVSTGLCGVIVIPLGFLLLIVPESPYWLVKHGRRDEALRSLAALRGPNSNIDKEFQDIQKGFLDQPSVSISDQFIRLKSPRNYRSVVLANLTVLLMILCGEHAITQYTVYLFSEANLDIDNNICAILVGIVYLTCNLAISFYIDRVGRRPLLMGASFLCATALILASLCLIYELRPQWVTLVFVLIYVMGLGIGTGPLFNTMTGELLPTPVRSIGISFCVMTSFVSSFIGSFCFPVMVSDFGLEVTCFVYAGFNLMMAFVAWKWVPETCGRTLVDLQDSLTLGKHSHEERKRDRNICVGDNEEKRALQPVTKITT